jgi:hypothetical protein
MKRQWAWTIAIFVGVSTTTLIGVASVQRVSASPSVPAVPVDSTIDETVPPLALPVTAPVVVRYEDVYISVTKPTLVPAERPAKPPAALTPKRKVRSRSRAVKPVVQDESDDFEGSDSSDD